MSGSQRELESQIGQENLLSEIPANALQVAVPHAAATFKGLPPHNPLGDVLSWLGDTEVGDWAQPTSEGGSPLVGAGGASSASNGYRSGVAGATSAPAPPADGTDEYGEMWEDEVEGKKQKEEEKSPRSNRSAVPSAQRQHGSPAVPGSPCRRDDATLTPTPFGGAQTPNGAGEISPSRNQSQGCDLDGDIDLDGQWDDEDCPPRAPPNAVPTMPMQIHASIPANRHDDKPPLKWGPPKEKAASSQHSNEEEEWAKRQRLTGAIARIVRYPEDERPAEDVLGLRVSRSGRIMVTAVREGGPASRAGVAAGDQLASINGQKDFDGIPASAIHMSLSAPVTLVFLGFVGKLQAEVRVKQPDRPRCGLATHVDLIDTVKYTASPNANLDARVRALAAASANPSASTGLGPNVVQLCDAVVFQPDATPWEEAASQLGIAQSSLFIAMGERSTEEANAPQMYELQREDARSILQRALYPPNNDNEDATMSI